MIRKASTNVEIGAALDKKGPWVTKLFSGDIKTVSFKDMEKLQDLLEVKYFGLERPTTAQSPLARKIAGIVDSNDRFAKIVRIQVSRWHYTFSG